MVYTITFYVCIAIMAVILLAGVKRRPKGEKKFFDRTSSKEMQGFLTIYIILHQTLVILVGIGENVRELVYFYYYGILAVVFFFFCSGYGLIKRYMSDGKYLKGFMRRRIYTVLVPFFVCNYIYLTNAIIYNILNGESFGFVELICSFFGIFLINNQMWFAVEIMILYVVFRLVFGTVKKTSTGIIIMTGVVLAIMVMGFFSKHSISPVMSYWFQGEWWYNTILMFPLGMFYAYKEEHINRVIGKAFASVVLGAAVLFVVIDHVFKGMINNSIFWTEYSNPTGHLFDKLMGLGTEILFELLFLVLLIAVMSRFKFDNPVLKFFGKISLEMIMLNLLMIDKLFFLYEKYGIAVYIPAVVVGTIACASVVYILKIIVLERKSGLFDGKVE